MLKMNIQCQAVAFPSFQGRVATRNSPHKHHLENRTNKKWLTPFFVLRLTRAPQRSEGLDRKNTVVGQFRGRAATSLNKQFGKISALIR